MSKALTVGQATRLSLVTTDGAAIEAFPVDVAGAGVAIASSFVWAPGQTGSGVYQDWPTLAAALLALPADTPKQIGCDSTGGALTVTNLGVAALVENCLFLTAGGQTPATITFDAGAQWAWSNLRLQNLVINVPGAGDQPPVSTTTTSGFLTCDNTEFTGGGQAFVHCGDAQELSVILRTSAVAAGTLLSGSATSSVTALALIGSTVPDLSIQLQPGGALALFADASSTVGVQIPNSPNAVAPLDHVPGTSAWASFWYSLADVYWDPQAGNDQALGNAVGAPVRTFAEIVRRYGSPEPQFAYGSGVIVHQLSAQNPNTDPVFFAPKLSGGGQSVLNALGGAVVAGADFAAGALGGGFGSAGAAPSAGGTPMTMAAVPAYVVAGVLLHNTTRDSYAFVDTVVAGTAKLSQPQTAASLTSTATIPAPVVDNDWAAGDNIHPLTLPLCNLKTWRARGGDLTAAGQPSGAFVLGANIADSSGNATSEYPLTGDGAVTALSLCQVNSRTHLGSNQGRGGSLFASGCYFAGQVAGYSCQAEIYGGVLKAGITIVSSSDIVLNNNVVVHGNVNNNDAGAAIGIGAVGCFADGGWTASTAGNAFAFLNTFWGSWSMSLRFGAICANISGGTWVAKALTTGALQLDLAGTGTSYAAGVWTDGVALTMANLDANNGTLQNPRSGSRYTTGT